MRDWGEVGWWDLPGPCRFVTRTADALLEAADGVLGLSLPTPSPLGLMDALERRLVEASSARAIRVDAAGGLRGRSPAHLLAAQAEIAPSGIRMVAEFLDSPALVDTVFLVENLPARDWMSWSMFLRALRAERAVRPRVVSPVVLVCLPPGVAPGDARAALGGHDRRWMGVAGRADTELLAERLMGWPGDDLLARVALSTVVEMSGWDPEMVHGLATAPIEQQLDPVPALAAHCEPYRDLVPSWANRLVDRWDGHPYVHTMSLVAAGDGRALRRRLWQARVRAVFPFISRVQSAFVARYESRVCAKLPREKHYHERVVTYDDPHKLELYDLYDILRDNLSGREQTLLYACYKLRTAMAHMDPGDIRRIREASEIWEQISEEFMTDCPGWEWPRCNQKMVALVGPSGAGKSTYAGQQFDAVEIVSSDAIRQELFGGSDVGGDQTEVFERVRREIIDRLASGQRVVVDATNLRSEDRLANVRLVPRDVAVEYVLIERPMTAKQATAGSRKDWVMRSHSEIFAEELPHILSGDGLTNVSVIVPRDTVLPVSKSA